MTYSDWEQEHKVKRSNLQRKLENQGLTEKQIIDYFDWSNMVVKQPEFCGLYKTKTKCHNIENLNCYNCGCPYFKYTDTPPLGTDGKKRFSSCTIRSKYSKDFETDGNIHCDCTDCTIPHTKTMAKRYYEKLDHINDSSSLLETIRGWQLFDILGRYKLF